MAVRVDEEGREDEGKDGLDVLADEVDDVLVVPVVQRAFGDLQPSPSPSAPAPAPNHTGRKEKKRTWKC